MDISFSNCIYKTIHNKETNRKLSTLNDRVIKLEESTKSAHHRIDNLEKRGVE